MIPPEAALLIIIVVVLLCVIFHYRKGQKGRYHSPGPWRAGQMSISIGDSIVMIEKWSPVSLDSLQSFRPSKDQTLEANEAKMASLKNFSERNEGTCMNWRIGWLVWESQAGSE